MPTAFLLINVEMGSEDEVLGALTRIDAVKEANTVFGVYDIVAKIKANTVDRLKEIITWEIRRLDKVRSTTTMIVSEKKA
ncbi:MAG: Lrp/AsnC ligand binding domain-containing protein [Candidatus Bathyarchaeota archaeon]|jgi:DNA-binding Lrp family transcriptional regulator